MKEYIVTYDENSFRTTDTKYEITDLHYCTVYEVQVAAVSEDESVGEYSETTVETYAPYRMHFCFRLIVIC